MAASSDPILILSIDGGGARGVIPVNVLYQIEQEAGVDIRGTFDFFAGVSTGALIAAYCAMGEGSVEVLARTSYSSDNMSRIFDKSVWDWILGRIQNQPKYDGINKRQYLEEVLGKVRINDIVDKQLMVIAYDFINRELITFKNRRGHDASYNPTLAEICDAATAAPTLYPPVPTTDIYSRWLIDGAVAINDPSVCAISEALAMGYTIDQIWMMSLGTGRPVHDMSQQQQDAIGNASRDWGIVGWLSNGLLDHMLSASSAVSAHQCQQLLGDRYLRVDGALPRALMKLDETTPGYVRNLRVHADLWYEANLDQIRVLLGKFQARKNNAATVQGQPGKGEAKISQLTIHDG
ncbi:MAG: patatin-like phospholipase family protein [Haliea sp.]|uniref:patatin-like phospholipase family protein n=1 Tax=Haliea sp. TaxID=1932666 RepID=UPI0032EF5E9D